MNEATLVKSRISLMDAIFSATEELISLGWKIEDGKATREEALSIRNKLTTATAVNSAENLEQMESLNIAQVN